MPNLRPLSWFRNTPAERPALADPFLSLQNEVDRLFEDFSKGFGLSVGRFRTQEFPSPKIDISETDDELKVEAELPGLDDDDVEVVLSDNILTIKGEKKQEHEDKRKDYHVIERSFGSFSRAITLPYEVDPDAIRANFKKGVLTITIPKPPQVQARARKIAIEH